MLEELMYVEKYGSTWIYSRLVDYAGKSLSEWELRLHSGPKMNLPKFHIYKRRSELAFVQ